MVRMGEKGSDPWLHGSFVLPAQFRPIAGLDLLALRRGQPARIMHLRGQQAHVAAVHKRGAQSG